jgi:dTDP-4-dehydrorhamnose reductase
MQKVVVLGAHGMLGHVLALEMRERSDIDLLVTTRSNREIDSPLLDEISSIHLDAMSEPDIKRVVEYVRPDAVINCIGVVKQRPEAHDPVVSLKINSLFPHLVANACAQVNARMIHVSTDCVFDGRKGSYVEEDLTNATDLYGRSKALGEVFEHQHTLTIRTSIIGHELASRLGLLEWALSQDDPIAGYESVLFSGLSTVELSRLIIEEIVQPKVRAGLFHVAGPKISKADLLKEIYLCYGKGNDINRVGSPNLDRSLNSDRWTEITGYTPPSWRLMLEHMKRWRRQYNQLFVSGSRL